MFFGLDIFLEEIFANHEEQLCFHSLIVNQPNINPPF